MNRVTLVGRIVGDPELKQSRAGLAYLPMKVATVRSTKKGPEVSDHDIIMWGDKATGFHGTRGKMVAVDGRLNYREYNGQRSVQIVASDVFVLSVEPNPEHTKAAPLPEPDFDESYSDEGDIPF